MVVRFSSRTYYAAFVEETIMFLATQFVELLRQALLELVRPQNKRVHILAKPDELIRTILL